MRLLRHLRRLFERAPVKYVLLLTPVQDADLRRYLLQVGLGEYAPEVLVHGDLPACRTGYPYISVTGEITRDDTAVREIAATEFGREFRELDESTHSFTTEDLSILLGDLAEGSRMLIARGPVARANAAARQARTL